MSGSFDLKLDDYGRPIIPTCEEAHEHVLEMIKAQLGKPRSPHRFVVGDRVVWSEPALAAAASLESEHLGGVVLEVHSLDVGDEYLVRWTDPDTDEVRGVGWQPSVNLAPAKLRGW